MYVQVIDYNLTEDNLYKLQQYIDLLLFWQGKINLISSSNVNFIWERHVYDSLQLLKHISDVENKYNYCDTSINIFDLGSGAGFPGLVLSIIDNKNHYYLIESNYKKTVFLEEVVRKLGLSNVTIINKRIEDLSNYHKKAHIITSRGLSSLNELLKYSYPLSFYNTVCLFLKGKNYQEEIKNIENNKSIITSVKSLTHSEGRLVIINNHG